MILFTASRSAKRHRCRLIARVSDRQERIAGWDQSRYSRAVGLFAGAGGANGEVSEGAVRKGLGTLHIADADTVEPTNLNRQKFSHRDLFKNKAERLCRNLSRQGFLGSTLVAHPRWFQDLDLDAIRPEFVVASVDNQIPGSRLEIATACHRRGIPAVFFAVSTDADWGYVSVQEPGAACWACAFKPEMDVEGADSAQSRCPGTPACADILKALAGIALYAIDTLVMERRRDWNLRVVSLSHSDRVSSLTAPRRAGCPVCGGEAAT